ncbi:MAG: DsbA family protein, partial [Chitinophagaceae bacterium]
MRPRIIYCYDAYCGWCYGFSPVIKELWVRNRNRFEFETLSGGMIPVESTKHISSIAGFIQGAYKNVEQLTGVEFGQDYLWHIFNPDQSDWFPCSEMPAIAMTVFREYHPDRTIEFACDLQYALHFEGRDLTDREAYRHLTEKYEIPIEEFFEKLKTEKYKEAAYYDFTLVQQLKVNGFPTLFILISDIMLYMIGRVFSDL